MLGISKGDPIEILMDSENQIILRKKRNPIVQATIEDAISLLQKKG